MSPSVHTALIWVFVLWVPAITVWIIRALLGRHNWSFDLLLFLWTILAMPLAFLVGSYRWGGSILITLIFSLLLRWVNWVRFQSR